MAIGITFLGVQYRAILTSHVSLALHHYPRFYFRHSTTHPTVTGWDLSRWLNGIGCILVEYWISSKLHTTLTSKGNSPVAPDTSQKQTECTKVHRMQMSKEKDSDAYSWSSRGNACSPGLSHYVSTLSVCIAHKGASERSTCLQRCKVSVNRSTNAFEEQ